MLSPDRYQEALAAADAANDAKTRMDITAAEFEDAQRQFNFHSRIAALVFGPTPEETSERHEFQSSPLGTFIKEETSRLSAVDGGEAAANVRLEDWTKAFDAREKISKLFCVDDGDLHVVLTPGHKGTLHGVSLMHMNERGLTILGGVWDKIMEKTAANDAKFCITLENGEQLDTRKGMTRKNYEAMIKQALTLDPESPLDGFSIYRNTSATSHSSMQPWLTGEPSFRSEMFASKRAALVGLVDADGFVSYGAPSTAAKVGHAFRPAVVISKPRKIS